MASNQPQSTGVQAQPDKKDSKREYDLDRSLLNWSAAFTTAFSAFCLLAPKQAQDSWYTQKAGRHDDLTRAFGLAMGGSSMQVLATNRHLGKKGRKAALKAMGAFALAGVGLYAVDVRRGIEKSDASAIIQTAFTALGGAACLTRGCMKD